MDFAGIGKTDWSFINQKLGDDERQSARVKTRAVARRTAQMKEAKDAIGALPQEGEASHAIISGRFDFMNCIALILESERSHGPCKLTISTLTFNARNVAELCALIDGGLIGELELLVSSFFFANTKDTYALLHDELAQRGPQHRLSHARSHAKITAWLWADETTLLCESSANLRTNSNIEFATFYRDRELYDWHCGWIRKLLTRGHGRQKSQR